MGFKSHIWKKKTPGVVWIRPGHGLTRRVDRVLPGCCPGRSFIKPEPVQPPGWPGPGSTRRAGPGFITRLQLHSTYGKLHCWLIVNLRHVSIYWSHLIFKTDLPSLRNLYLIFYFYTKRYTLQCNFIP